MSRPDIGPGGEWWLYAACAVAAVAASAAGFGRVGFGVLLVAVGVACWKLSRRET